MKLEGNNPSGSIKDRACVSILQSALKEGTLAPGKTVLDASSGNFACALALYAKCLGYSCEVAVSSKLTAEKRAFLVYLGARIHKVGDFTIQGNEFCRKLAESHPAGISSPTNCITGKTPKRITRPQGLKSSPIFLTSPW